MDIQARVIALNETRLKAWEEGKALLDAVGTREMTAEERQEWDRINTHINDIDAEVRNLVDTERREREAAQLRDAAAQVFGEHKAAQREQSESDQIRAWLYSADPHKGDFEIDIRRAAKERQLLRQGASPDEIRALSWDATSGSLVVPTTMARTLYEYLEARIAGFRMGATQISTSTGENMLLPTL